MRKVIPIVIVVLSSALISCSSKKETPASIAAHWCELNAKYTKAEGAAKEDAKQAREDYEKKMEKKYEKDQAFIDELEKEIEKCEDASEGRK